MTPPVTTSSSFTKYDYRAKPGSPKAAYNAQKLMRAHAAGDTIAPERRMVVNGCHKACKACDRFSQHPYGTGACPGVKSRSGERAACFTDHARNVVPFADQLAFCTVTVDGGVA